MSLLRCVAAALLFATLAACTAPPPPRELTAQEIVSQASEAMQTVKTVHFRLEMAEGRMTIVPGVTLDHVEGDAAAPDRISLKSKANVLGFVTDVELIGVGGQQYLRNPLTRQWEILPVAFALAKLFAPDEGAASLMKGAKNLSRLPNETVDGVESYHVKGTLEPAVITALAGGSPGTNPVSVEAWIGTKDLYVRQIRLQGAVTTDESVAVVRTMKLSKFNDPVIIEAPR